MNAFDLVDPKNHAERLRREAPVPLARYETNVDGESHVLAVYADKVVSSSAGDFGSSYSELCLDGSATIGYYDGETGMSHRDYSRSNPNLAAFVAANLKKQIDSIPGFTEALPAAFRDLFEKLEDGRKVQLVGRNPG